MRRALFVVASAAAGVVLPLSAAHADSTVVVRGLGFAPGSSTNLAVLGCTNLYDASAAGVTTYLSPSPGGPAGRRALEYDLDGGTAVGSQHHVSSMAATTVAGLSVLAPRGTTGVAYAVFADPQDAGSDLVWIGRAPLTVAGGAWQRVEAAALTYRWNEYDLGAEQPAGQDGGSSTVAEFLTDHGGDAAGLYAVGFGCDGNPFKIDALQTGSPGEVTTYDLEGYTTTTGISGSATRIEAGEPVTLHGSVSSDMVGPLAQGLLTLEAQQPGQGFEPVRGADVRVLGDGVSATVTPTAHTVYRWRFGGTSSTEASVSAPFVVDVASVVLARQAGVPPGGAAAVVGRTAPARAGAQVTLWRLGRHGAAAIASASTGADGGYSIRVPAAQLGTWRYYVSVAAGGGNLQGRSAVQTFTAPAPSKSPSPSPSPPAPPSSSDPASGPASGSASGSASPTASTR